MQKEPIPLFAHANHNPAASRTLEYIAEWRRFQCAPAVTSSVFASFQSRNAPLFLAVMAIITTTLKIAVRWKDCHTKPRNFGEARSVFPVLRRNDLFPSPRGIGSKLVNTRGAFLLTTFGRLRNRIFFCDA